MLIRADGEDAQLTRTAVRVQVQRTCLVGLALGGDQQVQHDSVEGNRGLASGVIDVRPSDEDDEEEDDEDDDDDDSHDGKGESEVEEDFDLEEFMDGVAHHAEILAFQAAAAADIAGVIAECAADAALLAAMCAASITAAAVAHAAAQTAARLADTPFSIDESEDDFNWRLQSARWGLLIGSVDADAASVGDNETSAQPFLSLLLDLSPGKDSDTGAVSAHDDDTDDTAAVGVTMAVKRLRVRLPSVADSRVKLLADAFVEPLSTAASGGICPLLESFIAASRYSPATINQQLGISHNLFASNTSGDGNQLQEILSTARQNNTRISIRSAGLELWMAASLAGDRMSLKAKQWDYKLKQTAASQRAKENQPQSGARSGTDSPMSSLYSVSPAFMHSTPPTRPSTSTRRMSAAVRDAIDDALDLHHECTNVLQHWFVLRVHSVNFATSESPSHDIFCDAHTRVPHVDGHRQLHRCLHAFPLPLACSSELLLQMPVLRSNNQKKTPTEIYPVSQHLGETDGLGNKSAETGTDGDNAENNSDVCGVNRAVHVEAMNSLLRSHDTLQVNGLSLALETTVTIITHYSNLCGYGEAQSIAAANATKRAQAAASTESDMDASTITPLTNANMAENDRVNTNETKAPSPVQNWSKELENLGLSYHHSPIPEEDEDAAATPPPSDLPANESNADPNGFNYSYADEQNSSNTEVRKKAEWGSEGFVVVDGPYVGQIVMVTGQGHPHSRRTPCKVTVLQDSMLILQPVDISISTRSCQSLATLPFLSCAEMEVEVVCTPIRILVATPIVRDVMDAMNALQSLMGPGSESVEVESEQPFCETSAQSQMVKAASRNPEIRTLQLVSFHCSVPEIQLTLLQEVSEKTLQEAMEEELLASTKAAAEAEERQREVEERAAAAMRPFNTFDDVAAMKVRPRTGSNVSMASSTGSLFNVVSKKELAARDERAREAQEGVQTNTEERRESYRAAEVVEVSVARTLSSELPEKRKKKRFKKGLKKSLKRFKKKIQKYRADTSVEGAGRESEDQFVVCEGCLIRTDKARRKVGATLLLCTSCVVALCMHLLHQFYSILIPIHTKHCPNTQPNLHWLSPHNVILQNSPYDSSERSVGGCRIKSSPTYTTSRFLALFLALSLARALSHWLSLSRVFVLFINRIMPRRVTTLHWCYSASTVLIAGLRWNALEVTE
jgi:hypothetical protein